MDTGMIAVPFTNLGSGLMDTGMIAVLFFYITYLHTFTKNSFNVFQYEFSYLYLYAAHKPT